MKQRVAGVAEEVREQVGSWNGKCQLAKKFAHQDNILNVLASGLITLGYQHIYLVRLAEKKMFFDSVTFLDKK